MLTPGPTERVMDGTSFHEGRGGVSEESSGTRTVLSKRTIISHQSMKTVKCEEDASAGSHDRFRKGGHGWLGGGGEY